jgi:hypothetical protein
MARDRRLWRADKEQTPGAAPLRAVTGFATRSESIRICLPSGCGSFWLKEEYSSVGVSTRYASVQKFFLSFQKSSATRHMRIFRGSLKESHNEKIIHEYGMPFIADIGDRDANIRLFQE